jgi:hypothetical protein
MVNLKSIKRSTRKNMAAEKLTKKRLIQILIMLIILLIAFSYRTFYHQPETTSQEIPQKSTALSTR